MTCRPQVQIVETEYGPLRLAASLNRRIDGGRPLLRATLDIHWHDPGAASALTQIEAALARFSPSFRHHECRGPLAYRVFVQDCPPSSLGTETDPGASARRETTVDTRPQPFDAGLALAHLIEHAVIDFESAITGETRISGVTGARRKPPGRFDLMVECPDPAVGRLSLALAVLSLTSAAEARPPGGREHDLLATARSAHHHPGCVFTPPGVARAFDWPLARADVALSSLRDLGYLAPLAYTINFSGVPCYRVAPA